MSLHHRIIFRSILGTSLLTMTNQPHHTWQFTMTFKFEKALILASPNDLPHTDLLQVWTFNASSENMSLLFKRNLDSKSSERGRKAIIHWSRFTWQNKTWRVVFQGHQWFHCDENVKDLKVRIKEPIQEIVSINLEVQNKATPQSTYHQTWNV